MPLPKKNRLSLRKSKEIFLEGKKSYSTHFTIVKSTIKDPQSTKPIFAIVVSKKTARKAHDRHKIRRLTSAAIFELLAKFPAGDYLVFPKSSVLDTSYANLLSDLLTITAKLK